jgi:HSP20 family protein
MTSVVKFSPFPATKLFSRGLVDDLFNRSIADYIGSDVLMNQPAVNIVEHDDQFSLELAAPGFDKQDFSINVENNVLIIEGKRESKTPENTAEKFTRREFRVEAFKRTFKLPETVNQEAITAVYTNGILNVGIPKKEEAKPFVKTIEIGG